MSAKDYDSLDEALEILKDTGPEFGTIHLSNHGPMAAEALCALGRGEAVVRWTERYRHRLGGPLPRKGAIAATNWRAALGDFQRAGDWLLFFARELAEAPWPKVLDLWVGRLSPGISAAAFHGVIRTGHAVRALLDSQNARRLHELAQGLAYWSARYHPLPEARGPIGGWQPSQALTHLELVPEDERVSAGNIVERMRPLESFTPFAMAANLVTPDTCGFLSNLTETFASAYLANAADIGNVIAFIHTVTGPAALRLMEPQLSPATRFAARRYCWQAAAGIYATFAAKSLRRELDTTADFAAPDGPPADLIDAAVRSGDEHAIKFTEACLRETALNGKPVYLAAARHAVHMLTRH